MSSRLILFALVAMAMAFAPLAMPIGQAMAAQSSHHETMAGTAKDDHCSGQSQQQPSEKERKSCCVAGCFALASLEVPVAVVTVPVKSADHASLDRFRLGVPEEIATPPPRLS